MISIRYARALTLYLRISLGVIVALMVVLPAVALGADAGTVDPVPPRTLVLPTDQLWALLAGGLSPLVSYLINSYAPWVSEGVKQIVFTVVAAVAAGVTQAITAGDVGFNQVTLQFVVSGVFAALMAHAWLWIRGPIGPAFGAGRNRNLERD